MKKEFFRKAGFTIGILLFVRLLAHIPIPGIKTEALKIAMQQYANDMFMLLNQMTGNAFQNMTLTGLGITPYITATIIIQLLCVASDRLGNLRRDGYYGYKKIEKWNIALGIFMSLITATLSAFALKQLGYLKYNNILCVLFVSACLCFGAVLLIGAGKLIEKKGIGNGISLILFINIAAMIPLDVKTLLAQNKKTLVIMSVVLGIVVAIILFMELSKKEITSYNTIAVGESKNIGQFSNIPFKLGICNVMPIIFVSIFYQIYSMIAVFLPNNTIVKKTALFFTTSDWFLSKDPASIAGIIFYCAVIIVMSYYYADMVLNPVEIASGLKQSRSYIPGVRPGNETVSFIKKERRSVIFINAVMLVVVSIVPILAANLLNVSLNMGATTLIIATGVLIEAKKAFKAEFYGVLYSKNWLNEDKNTKEALV